MNAEVCLGSVSNVQEAVKWLSYTYMFVRMKYNPLAYGLTYRTFETDPVLEQHREDLIRIAARLLDKTRMLRFDEASGALNPTDLGRTASHYYIKCNTIDLFNSKMKETMNDKVEKNSKLTTLLSFTNRNFRKGYLVYDVRMQ